MFDFVVDLNGAEDLVNYNENIRHYFSRCFRMLQKKFLPLFFFCFAEYRRIAILSILDYFPREFLKN